LQRPDAGGLRSTAQFGFQRGDLATGQAEVAQRRAVEVVQRALPAAYQLRAAPCQRGEVAQRVREQALPQQRTFSNALRGICRVLGSEWPILPKPCERCAGTSVSDGYARACMRQETFRK
jgi:hypothetical protein